LFCPPPPPHPPLFFPPPPPPLPQPLVDQLADGGRLLIPIGDREEQRLVVAHRKNGTIESRDVAPVRFVPLLGSHGWSTGEQ
jgi:protein-L-isoaspartate(D-aspartate) O-methyltransferase